MNDSTTHDMLMWIPKMLFLAITVIVVITIVYVFAYQDIKIDVLEMQLLTEEVYSSEGIMHQDILTKRIYPGIVDIEKFKTCDLSNVILTNRNDIALKLILSDGKTNETKYFISYGDDNEENFNILLNLMDFPERVSKIEPFPLIKPVTILENNQKREGKLYYYVLMEK